MKKHSYQMVYLYGNHSYFMIDTDDTQDHVSMTSDQ